MSRDLLSARCPKCGFCFKVERKFGGRVTRCPQPECSQKLRLPEASVVPPQRRSDSVQPEPSRKSGSRKRSETQSHRRRTVTKKRSRLPARFAGNQRWLLGIGIGSTILAAAFFIFAPSPETSSLVSSVGVPVVAAEEPPPPDPFREEMLPFVKQFCADCHNADDAQGGLDFSKYAEATSQDIIKGKAREHWQTVLAMLETGAMPPKDAEQPPEEQLDKLVPWLESTLYDLDCELIADPGRVTIRRLNRAEYNNTVRDVLGVDFKPADSFPSDDVGYGFDNIGDVLSLSPLLLEKYLDAAEAVAQDALPVYSEKGRTRHFAGNDLKNESRYSLGGEFWSMPWTGELFFTFDAKFDGDYEFVIRAREDTAGDESAKMELRLDSKATKPFMVKGRQPSLHRTTLSLKKGEHRIGVAFTNDFYKKDVGDRNLHVAHVDIVQPLNRERLNRFYIDWPQESGLSARESAAKSLQPFLRRAFRRLPTDEEVQKYAGMVETVVTDGEPFEFGMQLAVQAVLVSPSFLFRVESDENPNDPMAERGLTDFELASRLSYFLWSSTPDDELLVLAERGELRQPDILRQQTKRLLADDKARAIVDNFAEQWLNLRSLDELSPDPQVFPEWDDDLRSAMKHESLAVFEAIMRDDLSVLDFLDADFTFVNQRLAKHYGMADIKGDEFQRVALNPRQRLGVLTHASILTLTSNPNRTSPVKRGKWIMENILGKDPPPAPPGVPGLEETQKAKPNASLREQLVQHRADPGCAACHRTMDEIGFGLENFDAVGRWRDTDNGRPIDAGGELEAGLAFSGPVELVTILKTRSTDFARVFSERMLTYALGRGLEYYDRCAVDEILKRMQQNDYRFSELILAVVESEPFLKRRGDGERE